eukprot:TRINITY_DN11270_c0_g1_i2.p1 TRINITY_DN11270_c0_g1~~TRINITY_DN11270_c0_g1_i2.p1  ORF type:complete len:167 (-),score=3.67 TRINITY_DN11270_c0_g1_i2:394-894(-)
MLLQIIFTNPRVASEKLPRQFGTLIAKLFGQLQFILEELPKYFYLQPQIMFIFNYFQGSCQEDINKFMSWNINQFFDQILQICLNILKDVCILRYVFKQDVSSLFFLESFLEAAWINITLNASIELQIFSISIQVYYFLALIFHFKYSNFVYVLVVIGQKSQQNHF